MMKKMSKRLLLAVLALAMMICLTPTAALAAEPVSYLEYNTATGAFETKTCLAYTEITASTTAWTNGWYVVKSSITIRQRARRGSACAECLYHLQQPHEYRK